MHGFRLLGSALHFILGTLLLSFKQPYFRLGIWLGIHLRFSGCPEFPHHAILVPRALSAGALLGIVSRWSVLGLVKDPEHCNDCNRCLLRCQGGDDPIGGVPWHQPECHLCLNCVDECPEHGLRFEWFPRQKAVGANLQRRKVSPDWLRALPWFRWHAATPGFAAEHHERSASPSRSARRRVLPVALHSLRRVHEGLSEQRPAPRFF